MESLTVHKVKRLSGTIEVPGDKSISHRSVMLASIAEGTSRVENFLEAQDCLRTVEAFRQMGVAIQAAGANLVIEGRGLGGLTAPRNPLDMGNSGTTTRLLLGILAGQPFEATLVGDESLSQRPMRRVTEPLQEMGAVIKGREGAAFAPLTIRGGSLRAIQARLPVASAQVKSCLLLAGLYARGETSVTEPVQSRDHTERMLRAFGAPVSVEGLTVKVRPGPLRSQTIVVPGDISSAAFFLAAGILCPSSSLRISQVGTNPTRTGILDVLKRMGAIIEEENARAVTGEPAADLLAGSASLRATRIEPEEVPRLIDELPILMVAATQAAGVTEIRGAGELRVKETDRIASMVAGLSGMGAAIRAEGDTVWIEGPRPLHGARVKSFGDHRTAMSLAVAGLIAEGETLIEDTACVATSFPSFARLLEGVCV